ncbi:MAG: phosphate ABC transporter substrate-binding protein [Treponema sp.]|nr:phosphate ABC transporter substrate-binding protein [Treponema sp.]
MKRIGIAVIAGALALAPVFAGASKEQKPAAGGGAAAPYTIEVGGSTSVTPLMELFAEAYQKANPHIKININGTGSGDGIKNAGKLYQIGMTSRELTPAEQGEGLTEEVIAIDGIAVIVNKSNTVSGLSIEQIRNIYTGAITDWSQVSGGAKRGGIAVVSREEGSGTRGAFEELAGFQGKLLAGANESTSTGAIKAGIAGNEDAIGYISLGSVDDTVKALAIDGVAGTNANVVNGSYKIARPFIVLSGANLHPESKAFMEWMLGGEAQSIVKTSWIPVK